MNMNMPRKIPVTEQALNLSFFFSNTYKWMNDEKGHTNNMLTE